MSHIQYTICRSGSYYLNKGVPNHAVKAHGPKRGQGSIFNEYMASYEYDWEDAVFEEQHHRERYW